MADDKIEITEPETECCVPPVIDPRNWNRHIVLRETFLADVTDPNVNAALRLVTDLIHDSIFEESDGWPDLPHALLRQQLLGVLADLRVLEGYLTATAEEETNSELDTYETALARLAGAWVRRVKELGDEMEAELEHWPGEKSLH
jgi:hypothetical protein